MHIKNLSFITPTIKIDNDVILERNYSQYLVLNEETILSFASDAGHRETQQDSIAIYQKKDLILLLIADGMGGRTGGEKASYHTAKTIKDWFELENYEEIVNLTADTLKEKIKEIINQIIKTIPNKSGTTLNMSIITPKRTLIANIGDSRTYVLKNNNIKLITKDDSQSFEFFNPQTKEERNKLRFYIYNHILTNAICKEKQLEITVTTIKNEDYHTICHTTDGVSDILSEELIEEFCLAPNPAQTLVTSSIYQPRIEGNHHKMSDLFQQYIQPGKDNATAIVYTKKQIKNN